MAHQTTTANPQTAVVPHTPHTTVITRPENITHESRIPPIATKATLPASFTTSGPASSSLSFALPTSLAIFKRLTWELTCWTRPPLSSSTAAAISQCIPDLSDAIPHALCLGVGYPAATTSRKDEQPHLYVVFPHLRRDVSKDKDFLRVWHDEVVKPAFDEAWIRSGQVDVFEKTDGGTTWVTEKTAPAFDIVWTRFFREEWEPHRRPETLKWPWWEDVWAYTDPADARGLPRGVEGGFSDARARVLEEAWSAMGDMLSSKHGHPHEMSDPVLLAVWERKVEVDGDAAAEKLVDYVGKKWDEYADSRFVAEGKFVVHFEV